MDKLNLIGMVIAFTLIDTISNNPKYVCTFSVQKDTYLNMFITGKWFKLLGNYRHNLLISSVVEFLALGTGKSLSEALIFASINPQYDNRLFMELP